jgi:hypothetical protein
LNQKEQFRQVANILYNYKIKSHDHFILFKPTNILGKMRAKYPLIADAVNYLDQTTLENTNYVNSAINKAISEVKISRELERISKFIYLHIDNNKTYVQSELRLLIKKAYSESSTKRPPVTNDILLYYTGFRTTESKKNVYKLKEKRFLNQNTNSGNINF